MTKRKQKDIIKPKMTLGVNQYEKELSETHVGDIYYSSTYDCFYSIVGVEVDEYGMTYYQYETSEDGENWSLSDDRIEARQLKSYYIKVFLREGETLFQFKQSLTEDMLSIFSNEGAPEESEDDDANTTETALTVNKGMSAYQEAAYELARQKSRADILKKMAEARIERFRRMANSVSKKLRRVMRVLGVLEVYLGVREEIFQLTAGESADINEPISIRQEVLFMDEESLIAEMYNDSKGLHIEGTINHANVHKFDEWLLRDGNLDRILPELKGIVAIRPTRRRDLYEHDDAWTASEKQWLDKLVYLLIRNGENLYRVFTSLNMDETLYPTNLESSKMAEQLESRWESETEKAEELQIDWARNMLLVQGIIDRTEILHPLPVERINFNDPATYDVYGYVRLIRDAEMTLGDGSEEYTEWRSRINELVEVGSRVYIPGIHYSKDTWQYRFREWRVNCPSFPKEGVYTVEEVERVEGKGVMNIWILYLPNDPVYSRRRWWDEDNKRKKRISFKLHFEEFINYDEVNLSLIDYYLQRRATRRYYINKLPMLLYIREERKKEENEEKAFVELLSKKNGIKKEKLFELVEWWKKKTKTKRPISSDDQKAWRMIVAKARQL